MIEFVRSESIKLGIFLSNCSKQYMVDIIIIYFLDKIKKKKTNFAQIKSVQIALTLYNNRIKCTYVLVKFQIVKNEKNKKDTP